MYNYTRPLEHAFAFPLRSETDLRSPLCWQNKVSSGHMAGALLILLEMDTCGRFGARLRLRLLRVHQRRQVRTEVRYGSESRLQGIRFH